MRNSIEMAFACKTDFSPKLKYIIILIIMVLSVFSIVTNQHFLKMCGYPSDLKNVSVQSFDDMWNIENNRSESLQRLNSSFAINDSIFVFSPNTNIISKNDKHNALCVANAHLCSHGNEMYLQRMDHLKELIKYGLHFKFDYIQGLKSYPVNFNQRPVFIKIHPDIPYWLLSMIHNHQIKEHLNCPGACQYIEYVDESKIADVSIYHQSIPAHDLFQKGFGFQTVINLKAHSHDILLSYQRRQFQEIQYNSNAADKRGHTILSSTFFSDSDIPITYAFAETSLFSFFESIGSSDWCQRKYTLKKSFNTIDQTFQPTIFYCVFNMIRDFKIMDAEQNGRRDIGIHRPFGVAAFDSASCERHAFLCWIYI
jgi:hypothetical protein